MFLKTLAQLFIFSIFQHIISLKYHCTMQFNIFWYSFVLKLNTAAASAAAKSLQSCPTLCDPIDGSPPVSPVPGMLQARTRVGCHFLLRCMKVKSESEVAQVCPTLRDPMDCSLPGPSAHGIFQARVLYIKLYGSIIPLFFFFASSGKLEWKNYALYNVYLINVGVFSTNLSNSALLSHFSHFRLCVTP